MWQVTVCFPSIPISSFFTFFSTGTTAVDTRSTPAASLFTSTISSLERMQELATQRRACSARTAFLTLAAGGAELFAFPFTSVSCLCLNSIASFAFASLAAVSVCSASWRRHMKLRIHSSTLVQVTRDLVVTDGHNTAASQKCRVLLCMRMRNRAYQPPNCSLGSIRFFLIIC
jgi:hypothetical protein